MKKVTFSCDGGDKSVGIGFSLGEDVFSVCIDFEVAGTLVVCPTKLDFSSFEDDLISLDRDEGGTTVDKLKDPDADVTTHTSADCSCLLSWDALSKFPPAPAESQFGGVAPFHATLT